MKTRDPVLDELYEALRYHEHTPAGSLIEMGCQRCSHTEVGGSPRVLAQQIWEHMRRHHPEAWTEDPSVS